VGDPDDMAQPCGEDGRSIRQRRARTAIHPACDRTAAPATCWREILL